MGSPEPGAELGLLDEHALNLLHVIDTCKLDLAPKVDVFLQDAVFSLLFSELAEDILAFLHAPRSLGAIVVDVQASRLQDDHGVGGYWCVWVLVKFLFQKRNLRLYFRDFVLADVNHLEGHVSCTHAVRWKRMSSCRGVVLVGPASVQFLELCLELLVARKVVIVIRFIVFNSSSGNR
jgi:hypothetical protein